MSKVIRERYLYLGVMPSASSTHSNYLHSPYFNIFILFRASREMVQLLQSLLVLGLAAGLSWASPQVITTESEALVKQRALAPGDQYVFAFCPRYVIVCQDFIILFEDVMIRLSNNI